MQFFDVIVALVRKVVKGEVRTGYLFKGLDGNPALKYEVQVWRRCLGCGC